MRRPPAICSPADSDVFLRTADTEPIPGYRLLKPLGKGGFGEVWKCQAPGGLLKAVKFVYGNAQDLEGSQAADEEGRAIERIKAIRHPFLLAMDRVEVLDGDLVIVMELADQSLQELLEEYRKVGLPGVPRDELLGYLADVAEALDLLNTSYDLQHLDVKPRNLLLVSNHVKVGDFGLVNSLQPRGGQPPSLPPGAVTPLYGSPETFQGSISRHSDQYSLAIVYQELLTGTLPFGGRNARQLFIQHLKAHPDLQALPEADRPIVARALSKDPTGRFESCGEFIEALGALGSVDVPAPQATREQLPRRRKPGPQSKKQTRPVKLARTPRNPRAKAPEAPPATQEAPEQTAKEPLSPLHQVLSDIAAALQRNAGASTTAPENRQARAGSIQSRFTVALPSEVARLRLDGLRRLWNGKLLPSDAHAYVFRVSAPRNFWQRYIGRQPGLVVEITLQASLAQPGDHLEVDIQVRPDECEPREAQRLLLDEGKLLLDSSCKSLQTHAKRRTHDRIPWYHPLRVLPLAEDGSAGKVIECHAKDISTSGIGFYLPYSLPTSIIRVHLTATDQTPALEVPARIVRVQRCGDGWYEVGALFLSTGQGPALGCVQG